MHKQSVVTFPQTFHFSLHHFHDLENTEFSVSDYSKMKFGSDLIAKSFSHELADAVFLEHYPMFLEPCVVVATYSGKVETAGTLMSKHFANRLNHKAVKHNLGEIGWTAVHRRMSYNNNYADLQKEDRIKLLSNDEFFFNRDFIAGKTMIFVDDCTITGTHENIIMQSLRAQHIISNVMFVSYAKYLGEDASIESRLNHQNIKDATDLAFLAHEQEYEITTRAVRLFLETPSDEFLRVAENAPKAFANNAYYSALTKGYHTHEPYRENLKLLENLVLEGK